mmetsp:Transcript_45962/g.133822  ORF Transcript_45962/g.133822 Transcript_45962/m.133822 type:complete len:93 (+) Transcript_45962:77-355(+)
MPGGVKRQGARGKNAQRIGTLECKPRQDVVWTVSTNFKATTLLERAARAGEAPSGTMLWLACRLRILPAVYGSERSGFKDLAAHVDPMRWAN